jgi:hypothetical protein
MCGSKIPSGTPGESVALTRWRARLVASDIRSALRSTIGWGTNKPPSHARLLWRKNPPCKNKLLAGRVRRSSSGDSFFTPVPTTSHRAETKTFFHFQSIPISRGTNVAWASVSENILENPKFQPSALTV